MIDTQTPGQGFHNKIDGSRDQDYFDTRFTMTPDARRRFGIAVTRDERWVLVM